MGIKLLPEPGAPIKEQIDRKKEKAKKGKKGKSKSSTPLGGGPISEETIAEKIRRQALEAERRAAQEAGNSQAQIPSLLDQYNAAAAGLSPHFTALEELRRIAANQVNAKYNPLIEALQGEMDRKTSRSKRDQKSASQMFNALGADIAAQLPELTQQYAAEDKEANARYDTAQEALKSQYGQQAQEQAELMKQLGIEAALPEASQQAREDQSYFQNQMELDQQQALSAMNQVQNAGMDYTRQSSSNAKMAGVNRVQELGQQLSDYLDQAGGQLSTYQGQKKSDLAMLVDQLQAQDQQNAQQAYQQQLENLRADMGLQMQMQEFQAKMNPLFGGGAGFADKSGPAGMSNYLAGMYPNQDFMAEQLANEISKLMQRPEVTRQGMDIPGAEADDEGEIPDYPKLSEMMLQDMLRQQMGTRGGAYQPYDINQAIQALMVYMGKYR